MEIQKGNIVMKNPHFARLAVALILMLSLCLTFTACTSTGNGTDDTTVSDTQDDNSTTLPETDPVTDPATDPVSETETAPVIECETDPETETEPASETEAPTESETEPVPETWPEETDPEETDPEETFAPMDLFADEIQISTPEELIEFGKFINYELDEDFYPDDWYGLDGQTVLLMTDIDLAGYEWHPLDGDSLCEVTFDGQGHTIKNMTINYNTERTLTGSDDPYLGCGFVGTAVQGSYLTFQNITFEDTYILARERHVGCVVGRSMGADCTFENITVKNFTVDGWCDYDNGSEATGGYPISFRIGGIMGCTFAGYQTFTNCTVDGMVASGFHNLAGILGYDGSRLIDEYSFEGCHVENVRLVFSYWMAPAYDPDMPRRFVSVFFNGSGWYDNIDACLENGNTYANVHFYDWTSTEENSEDGIKNIEAMDEYDASEFRSWTEEEANA